MRRRSPTPAGLLRNAGTKGREESVEQGPSLHSRSSGKAGASLSVQAPSLLSSSLEEWAMRQVEEQSMPVDCRAWH